MTEVVNVEDEKRRYDLTTPRTLGFLTPTDHVRSMPNTTCSQNVYAEYIHTSREEKPPPPPHPHPISPLTLTLAPSCPPSACKPNTSAINRCFPLTNNPFIINRGGLSTPRNQTPHQPILHTAKRTTIKGNKQVGKEKEEKENEIASNVGYIEQAS